MFTVLCVLFVLHTRPVAEAVVQEAVEAAKAAGPLGSSSGKGLPQIERIRLNVHANQVRCQECKPRSACQPVMTQAAVACIFSFALVCLQSCGSGVLHQASCP